MRMDYPPDPLLPNTPPSGKSVLGLVTVLGEGRLVLELSSRNCTAQASVLVRPCFCDRGIIPPLPMPDTHSLGTYPAAHSAGGRTFSVPTTR